MAKIRDRTGEFKDAVRHSAISLGYKEVKFSIILFICFFKLQSPPYINCAEFSSVLAFWHSKMAAIMASFIIHKPRRRSPFTRAALKTLENIGALEQLMLKHRKDYEGWYWTRGKLWGIIVCRANVSYVIGDSVDIIHLSISCAW